VIAAATAGVDTRGIAAGGSWGGAATALTVWSGWGGDAVVHAVWRGWGEGLVESVDIASAARASSSQRSFSAHSSCCRACALHERGNA
jgi:hypothetical protein